MPADLEVGILIPRGGCSTNDVLGISGAISVVNYEEFHTYILDGPAFTTERLDL